MGKPGWISLDRTELFRLWALGIDMALVSAIMQP
jgi:hypothetical protein